MQDLRLKPWQIGFFEALGVSLYISLFALGVRYTSHFPHELDPFFGVMMMLSLFVFSALVCGSLILGMPLYLILKNNTPAALRIFFFSVMWLLINIAILAAIILLFVK